MNIREVSQRVGLSADTIRYYERIGLLPAIGRSAAGVRYFTQEDLAILEFIACFRSVGMPIETLLVYMGMIAQGEETVADRRRILEGEKERLLDEKAKIEQALLRLEQKLTDYDNRLARFEGGLLRKQKEETI